MGQIDKKLKNQLFKVAVDYIYQEHLADSQGELAKKIGISDSALSRIMNDKKFVGDDTLRKMNEAFGGIFNMAYFRGEDPQCMLMEDLLYYKQHPEERLVFEQKPQEPTQPLPNDNTFMMSKVFESFVKPIEAAHAQTVAALNQQIAEKQSRIDDLERAIADKDTIIRARESRILELERRIAQLNSDDLSKYPYAIGVAEERTNPQNQNILK
ncbi:MAG: helix-turn-helix domain-containing protein [Prevotella sp.]|nr:helix-turn-helix domain-containing protein [Prevotella sp.]